MNCKKIAVVLIATFIDCFTLSAAATLGVSALGHRATALISEASGSQVIQLPAQMIVVDESEKVAAK